MGFPFEKPVRLSGILFISIITSVATTLATLVVVKAYSTRGTETELLPMLSAVPVSDDLTKCGALVYSPVQNACVEQAVFDGEMQRLFKALGVDPSIYRGQ